MAEKTIEQRVLDLEVTVAGLVAGRASSVSPRPKYGVRGRPPRVYEQVVAWVKGGGARRFRVSEIAKATGASFRGARLAFDRFAEECDAGKHPEGRVRLVEQVGASLWFEWMPTQAHPTPETLDL